MSDIANHVLDDAHQIEDAHEHEYTKIDPSKQISHFRLSDEVGIDEQEVGVEKDENLICPFQTVAGCLSEWLDPTLIDDNDENLE